MRENIAGAEIYNAEVIRPRDNPPAPKKAEPRSCAGIFARAARSSNIPPWNRASCATRGPAVVFRDYPDLAARLDDPALPATADSILVLQNAGPCGAPGMPEWGMLPLPKKLLEAGVRDVLRISDARMSGTSYGACVLHVAPESAVGGPLAPGARWRHHHPRCARPHAHA